MARRIVHLPVSSSLSGYRPRQGVAAWLGSSLRDQRVGLAGTYSVMPSAVIGDAAAVRSKSATVVVVFCAPAANTVSASVLNIGGGTGIRLDATTSSGGVYAIWTYNSVANGPNQALAVSAFSTAPLVTAVSIGGSTLTAAFGPLAGAQPGIQSDILMGSIAASMIMPPAAIATLAASSFGVYLVGVLPYESTPDGLRDIVRNPGRLLLEPRRVWITTAAPAALPTLCLSAAGALTYQTPGATHPGVYLDPAGQLIASATAPPGARPLTILPTGAVQASAP